MNKEKVKLLLEIIRELAYEIRNLKEAECGNSGLNWFDEFENNLHLAEIEFNGEVLLKE